MSKNRSLELKSNIRAFWEAGACGEALYLSGVTKADFERHSSIRYRLEPYILDFANFEYWGGKRVLEIGVGLGSDHLMFAKNGANLQGIDITDRAVNLTKLRLNCYEFESSNVLVADAENLKFQDGLFDLVYSWGVIHHSPRTERAVSEIHRVLCRSGVAKVMIYNKWSLVGIMLWLRYGLGRAKPWLSLNKIYGEFLESPGTQAFTEREARILFKDFSSVEIEIVLSTGDLLLSSSGQRHQGVILTLARRLWPRWLFRRIPSLGLFMLITAKK